MRAVLAGSFVLFTGVAGCDPIDDFRTAPGEVFYGDVIGSDHDGGVSFIRSGFPARTQMELVFDVEHASSRVDPDGAAGGLRTFVCKRDRDPCPAGDREPGQFDGSPLLRLPNLTHDALSQYDFPGGGRLRNYMFGVRFAPTAESSVPTRDGMVFLSLMENGKIEVRVIAQSLLGPDGAEVEPPLFGVFSLDRRPL